MLWNIRSFGWASVQFLTDVAKAFVDARQYYRALTMPSFKVDICEPASMLVGPNPRFGTIEFANGSKLEGPMAHDRDLLG